MFPPGRARLATMPVLQHPRECHDNGDRLGRVFSSLRCFSPAGKDDVTVETDELGGKVWQTFNLALPIPVLECDVLPLDVADLA